MVQKSRLTKFLDLIHLPTWIVLILALVLLLRIPSFFEPYSYGDETIYLTLGEGIRQGKILYKDVHDNKPPLIYVVAAIAGNVFWFKTILAFWSLFTVVLFWKLTKVLFPEKLRLQQIATIIFALLTTLPLLEGNIANAENFMMGFSILGFLILLKNKLNFTNLFFAGSLFGIATLFKVPAAFDLPAIVFYWLIVEGISIKNVLQISKRSIFIVLGFIFPIALSLIWYAGRGALNEYIVSGFLQNFGYLSTFRPSDTAKPFLEKNAPLIIRGLITLFGVLALYPFRKRLSKQFVFLTCWLLLTLFAVTLSERPYPHYLLQSTPPISIMLAMLFALPTLEQSLVILPLTLALVVPIYYKFWYYSTSDYYARFIGFATRQTSKDEYLGQFGSHVPRAYKIAEVVSSTTSKKDSIFVWGPESQTVYALSRRFPPIKYVAQYHISDFADINEVTKTLQSSLPKVVILLPNSTSNSGIDLLLKENYILIRNIDGAQIFLRCSKNLKAVR